MQNIWNITQNLELSQMEKKEIETTIEFFSKTDLKYIFRALYVWIWKQKFRQNPVSKIDEIYLPKDLNYVDLLELTQILTKSLGLENELKIENLLIKTKILTWKILKNSNLLTQNDLWEMDFTKYFSRDTFERIENIKINNTVWRKFLQKNNYDDKNEEIQSMFNQLKNEIINIFIIIFFKKWLKDITKDLHTYSEIDLELQKYSNQKVENYEQKQKIDFSSRPAKDKLKLDKLKRIINSFKTPEVIKIITQKIFDLTREYPYFNDWENSSLTRWIIESKQLNCTGQTLVAHAFLEELDIPHKALITNWHISLSLEIDGKKYLFDPTNFKDLLEIKVLDSDIRNYNMYYIVKDNPWINYLDYDACDFMEIETNRALIQSMLWTISDFYFQNNDFQKALFYNKQAINTEFKNINFINFRKTILEKNWQSKLANLYKYYLELIKWENPSIWLFDKKIKSEIYELVMKNELKNALIIIFQAEKKLLFD